MKKIFIIKLLIFLTIFSYSQNRTIEGKVYNLGGGVLTGVRVFAKQAPAIFTLTDEKGSFKLNLPEEVTELVFSYSGMAEKKVKIGKFDVLTIKLVPANFKKIRFGFGFAFGTSNFEVYNVNGVANVPDTTKITLTPIAINVNTYYKLGKHFDLQAMLTDGLNVAKFKMDSITSDGRTVEVSKNAILNRLSFAILANYNFNVSKSQNHSAFVGLGPQYQYFSFFKTNTIGARFHAGVNINNYGLTTRLFAAVDVSNGEFGDNVAYVKGFRYKYFSGRIGLTFIF